MRTGRADGENHTVLLAIDYIEDGFPERADLKFFYGRSDVEWIELGRAAIDLNRISVGGSTLSKLERAIAQGRYEAILFGAAPPVWNVRKNFFRNLAKSARYLLRDPAALAKWRTYRGLVRHVRGMRNVAGIDRTDSLVIDNSRFAALDASRVYFKRELPQNPLNTFLYTSDKAEYTSNVLHIPFFRDQLDKLAPVAIGLEDETVRDLASRDVPKDVDLFFAGELKHRPARIHGMKLLQRLRDEGYKLDLPEEPLPKKAYFERASRALLAWSPEGYGYECYRTYEMAALGCVPILQYPTIQRHAPFADGESVLHYFIDDDSLYHVVKRALDDRNKLREIGRRAREHVVAHHTHSALGKHVLDRLNA